MRSKTCPASIKHVSYSIVRVWYRTSVFQCQQAASHSLPLVLEKYLCTSLASALAASRRVCCALLISLPSTALRHAHTRWVPRRKLMMVLKHPKKRKKLFSFQEMFNILKIHDAGITNVKSRNLGVHATMFRVSFPYSGNISAIYMCYASWLRQQFWLKTSSEKFWQHKRN